MSVADQYFTGVVAQDIAPVNPLVAQWINSRFPSFFGSIVAQYRNQAAGDKWDVWEQAGKGPQAQISTANYPPWYRLYRLPNPRMPSEILEIANDVLRLFRLILQQGQMHDNSGATWKIFGQEVTGSAYDLYEALEPETQKMFKEVLEYIRISAVAEAAQDPSFIEAASFSLMQGIRKSTLNTAQVDENHPAYKEAIQYGQMFLDSGFFTVQDAVDFCVAFIQDYQATAKKKELEEIARLSRVMDKEALLWEPVKAEVLRLIKTWIDSYSGAKAGSLEAQVLPILRGVHTAYSNQPGTVLRDTVSWQDSYGNKVAYVYKYLMQEAWEGFTQGDPGKSNHPVVLRWIKGGA